MFEAGNLSSVKGRNPKLQQAAATQISAGESAETLFLKRFKTAVNNHFAADPAMNCRLF